jgi:1-deoxy-D-xylulose-5-phosphate synthase
MDRAGLVGADGPTHHGVFDLAYLRTLPNLTLAAPRDATDLGRLLELALAHPGPFAVRYPRDNCPGIERIHASERRELAPGKAEVLLESDTLTIWALGPLVQTALEVAERLQKRGVAVGVVDARFVKPLDEELLCRQAQSTRLLVTLEEHQRAGGFGSAVLETLAKLPGRRADVRVFALPDRFVEHMTTREEQLAAAGLDADGLERSLRNLLMQALV